MRKISVSKVQAKSFLLNYHHLGLNNNLNNKKDIIALIKRLGCIQFDPLNIVGHNQELMLQSRINSFSPKLLTELLYTDRVLLDGWDKNMAIFLTEDWPHFYRRREACLKHYTQRNKNIMEILPKVRRVMAEKGPLCSRDLDFDKIVGWSWAPTRLARAALDSMFFWGEIIVHHRVHTRKYYDFTINHIASDVLEKKADFNSDEEYYEWYVLRRLGGVGLLWERASDAWVGIYDMKSAQRKQAVAKLIEKNKLIEVFVEGAKYRAYMRKDDMDFLESQNSAKDPEASILAPLDNMLWDRKFIKELFDFEYIWEVYKPVEQRLYGYYVLPVLYGDRFIARFEPAKESDAMIIKNWWWEPGIKMDISLKEALVLCFKRFISAMGFKQLRLHESIKNKKQMNWVKII